MRHDIFYIAAAKCTECVGFFAEEQCAAVCPVDCCVPDPDIPETEAQLIARARALHPDRDFGTEFPSRFRRVAPGGRVGRRRTFAHASDGPPAVPHSDIRPGPCGGRARVHRGDRGVSIGSYRAPARPGGDSRLARSSGRHPRLVLREPAAVRRAVRALAASRRRICRTRSSAGSLLVACCYADGMLFTGGWLLLFTGTLDIIDGRVARRTNGSSARGAFLDSIIDRYADSFGLPRPGGLLPRLAGCCGRCCSRCSAG